MVAQEKTYVHLEPHVIKALPQMTARDLTHVMYAYSVRGAGNPELHAAFEKQISPLIEQLDYPGLHNLIYYMLFRENANKDLWRRIVQTTTDQLDIMPLIYYKPFKASMIFLSHHFGKEWDGNRVFHGTFLSDYQDKFFHAEKYFNVVKFDDLYESDGAYKDFRAFLTGHCNVYPTPFMSVAGLFTLHYVFFDQKIAIQLLLKKFAKPDQKASEMQKLPQKIMKLEGWEILNLTEAEFKDWTYDQRVEQIKGWLRAAKVKQIEKGVLPEVDPVYV